MKKFDRDSYDFIKANLEVQEMLKIDIDYRVEMGTKTISEKARLAKEKYYKCLDDTCDMKF